jgi:glutamate N-acetyltransferase/amino-acid N-acetyltransferase
VSAPEATTFFRSRWVDVPDGVREVPGAPLPAGFRAAGAAAGIKPSGGLDVGLLVSDSEETTSAARFTRSGTAAPPVLVTRDRARLDALKAIAVNSGNANAATGGRGMDEAARMQGAGAMMGRTTEDRVAVCSTGVIGVQLDGHKVVRGLLEAGKALAPEGIDDFQQSIMTTDLFEKRGTIEIDLPGGTVRLAAQSKGAGMIQPSFATMLCFIETDAIVAAETAELLRSTGSRSTVSCRPTTPRSCSAGAPPALRCSRSPRARSSSARRSTRCCGSWPSTCAAMARAPGASAA